MSALRQQISQFSGHYETPANLVLRGHSFGKVFQEIDSILKSADPEAIGTAMGFVRDATLFEHPFRAGFRKHLKSAAIWETFSKLLLAPNLRIRSRTISTIGRLTVKDRADLLVDAFPYYLEKDPINLPSLLMEHWWLADAWNWNLIEQVVVANHYLPRWSLCEIIGHVSFPAGTINPFMDLFFRLKGDPHPLVAAEASWHFESLAVKVEPKLPKPEWRKEVKRIASLEPRVTFENTALRFQNSRAESGKTDYTVDEFDRFVTGMGKV